MGKVSPWIYVLVFFLAFIVALSVFMVLFSLGVHGFSLEFPFDGLRRLVSSIFSVKERTIITKTVTETRVITRTVTKTVASPLSSSLPKEFSEVVFSRTFIIEDFVSGKRWIAAVSIPASTYFEYRLHKKHEPMVLSTRINYIRNLVEPNNKAVKAIADLLWDFAGGDPELFAVFVLQLTHQMVYKKTLYAKYPVETLVEWSGDCGNLAVLAASILKAKGLDVIILLIKTKEGYHALLGVNLPHEPKLPGKYGRTKILYFTNPANPEKKYYAAEVTWKLGEANLYDPYYIGTLIGDPSWEDFKIEKVVKI